MEVPTHRTWPKTASSQNSQSTSRLAPPDSDPCRLQVVPAGQELVATQPRPVERRRALSDDEASKDRSRCQPGLFTPASAATADPGAGCCVAGTPTLQSPVTRQAQSRLHPAPCSRAVSTASRRRYMNNPVSRSNAHVVLPARAGDSGVVRAWRDSTQAAISCRSRESICSAVTNPTASGSVTPWRSSSSVGKERTPHCRQRSNSC